jgi:CDP-diacylglycerol--glycerol-3-phosphate 3-phosphatidyltransferase
MRDVRALAPIALTSLRLVMGPAMVAVAHANGERGRGWLVGMLTAGMLSDFADGIAARRLGVQSVSLRRFDSRADVVFWACTLWCVWVLSPGIVRERWCLIVGLVGLHAAASVFARVRGKDELEVGSLLAKAMGIWVFAGFVEMLWTGRVGWVTWVMVAWVVVAEMDVIAIAALAPGKKVWSAWAALSVWNGRRGRP